MVTFLLNKYIKKHGCATEAARRQACGLICGLCGIAINILLFAAKLTVGVLSGSIAAVADAFNNLSDAGSSIVTLAGFRLAAQAPDREHPYGHGRFEYISGMIVSVAVILMGFELLRSGLGKILHPSAVEVSAPLMAVLVLSIGLKLYMAAYNNGYGKKINSAAMRATAADSLGDCAATGAVLLSAVVGALTPLNIDGWAGVAVAALIFIAGIRSFKSTVTLLLGSAPSPEFVRTVEETVRSYGDKGVVGIHDLAVHDYGPGRVMISLHAEVSGADIYAMHEVIDSLEREISQKLDCETVIHMDPSGEAHSRTDTLRTKLEAIIKERINSDVTVHDLRLSPGADKELLTFDSVIPAALAHEADAVKERIERAAEEAFPAYEAATKIDIRL